MPGAGDSDSLVREIVAHQDRLFRYIFSLCPREQDAGDILQEACVALLRHADKYDASQPFMPWAYRFAQLEVLKHRERVARSRRVFDADVIELLARQRQGIDEQLQAQLVNLDSCVEALAREDRKLIESRYKWGAEMSLVAAELGVSRRTVFRNLRRVRRLLLECLSAKTAEALL